MPGVRHGGGVRLMRFRPRLTYANVVSTICLFIVLGGGAWAATALPRNSVGTRQLRKNAVTGAKVRNHSLTGADIKAATLGEVPLAASAESASTASHATSADTAGHATTAGSADHAADAGTAERATSAASASHATSADTAGHATTAGSADHAADAGTAERATTAATAERATSATSAAHATSADTATTAGDATTLDGKGASAFVLTSHLQRIFYETDWSVEPPIRRPVLSAGPLSLEAECHTSEEVHGHTVFDLLGTGPAGSTIDYSQTIGESSKVGVVPLEPSSTTSIDGFTSESSPLRVFLTLIYRDSVRTISMPLSVYVGSPDDVCRVTGSAVVAE